MKVPKDTAEGGFMIGNQKFALFASLVLIPIEEHAEQSGLIYRAGEISCLSTSEDTGEGGAPFDMNTAMLMPMQLPANNVSDAAILIAEEVEIMAAHIIERQERVASDERDDGAGVWTSPEADALMEGIETDKAARKECCGDPDHCSRADNERPEEEVQLVSEERIEAADKEVADEKA